MCRKTTLLKIGSFFLCFIFLFSPYVLAEETQYVWSNKSRSLNTTLTSVSTDTSEEIPSDNSLSLESGSAVLIEQSSGRVLYNHNMHEQLRPASVTKVMSILLIMDAIDSGRITLQDKVPCSSEAAAMGGSQIWLDTKEELTVDEMLKAICVVSANDCVVAMAEYLEGSQEAFVSKMNERAQGLGMKDTSFKNCHGIDEDGHVTSSYDISLMSRELLLKHPSVTKYTTIWMDSLRNGKSELVNTNKLIRNYQGATGLKTGSTSLALYNLSASATRNDLSLIAVIMKAPTTKIRFAEAQKLLDYGFSNYSYSSFAKKNDIVKEISVNKGVSSYVTAIFQEDAGTLVKKGQEKEVIQNISIDDILQAPVLAGQKIGEATYSLNGKILSSVPIVAEADVPKDTFMNMLYLVLEKWFCLLR